MSKIFCRIFTIVNYTWDDLSFYLGNKGASEKCSRVQSLLAISRQPDLKSSCWAPELMEATGPYFAIGAGDHAQLLCMQRVCL